MGKVFVKSAAIVGMSSKNEKVIFCKLFAFLSGVDARIETSDEVIKVRDQCLQLFIRKIKIIPRTGLEMKLQKKCTM